MRCFKNEPGRVFAVQGTVVGPAFVTAATVRGNESVVLFNRELPQFPSGTFQER